jgi:hypothetical protein
MRFLSHLPAKWLASIGGGKWTARPGPKCLAPSMVHTYSRPPRSQVFRAAMLAGEVEFLRGMVRRNSVMYFC